MHRQQGVSIHRISLFAQATGCFNTQYLKIKSICTGTRVSQYTISQDYSVHKVSQYLIIPDYSIHSIHNISGCMVFIQCLKTIIVFTGCLNTQQIKFISFRVCLNTEYLEDNIYTFWSSLLLNILHKAR